MDDKRTLCIRNCRIVNQYKVQSNYSYETYKFVLSQLTSSPTMEYVFFQMPSGGGGQQSLRSPSITLVSVEGYTLITKFPRTFFFSSNRVGTSYSFEWLPHRRSLPHTFLDGGSNPVREKKKCIRSRRLSRGVGRSWEFTWLVNISWMSQGASFHFTSAVFNTSG